MLAQIDRHIRTRRSMLTQGLQLHLLTHIDRLIKATRDTTHRRPPRIDRDPPRKTPGRNIEASRARRPPNSTSEVTQVRRHTTRSNGQPRRAEFATGFVTAPPGGLLRATASPLLHRRERSCDHGKNGFTHFGPVRRCTHSLVQNGAVARPPPQAARNGGDPTRCLVRVKGNPLGRQNRAAPVKLGTTQGDKGPTRHTNRAAEAPTPAQHTCGTQQKNQHRPLDARSHQTAWQGTMTA